MENKWLQKWGLSFLLILISGLTFQMEATATSQKVKLEGKWQDIRRSAPFELPVSAFVDGSVLSIQSHTADVDITVVVSQNGVPVYEKIIPASQTSQVVIDISGWEKGKYVLELRNKWGEYLFGTFSNNCSI